MIKWKSVEEHTPQNFTEYKDLELIPCIVWFCNPKLLSGGFARTITWNVKKQCWNNNAIEVNWFDNNTYKITHFCDEINIPEEVFFLVSKKDIDAAAQDDFLLTTDGQAFDRPKGFVAGAQYVINILNKSGFNIKIKK